MRAEREALKQKWSARQKVYLGFIKQRNELKKKIVAAKGEAKAKLEEELKPALVEVGKLNKEVSALNRSIPELPPSAMAVVDGNATDSPGVLRGDRGSKGKEAARGVLGALGVPARKIGARESGRLQLAEWIVNKRNPLTTRVMVNRVWLHLFGHGLVTRRTISARSAQSRAIPNCSMTWRFGSWRRGSRCSKPRCCSSTHARRKAPAHWAPHPHAGSAA